MHMSNRELLVFCKPCTLSYGEREEALSEKMRQHTMPAWAFALVILLHGRAIALPVDGGAPADDAASAAAAGPASEELGDASSAASPHPRRRMPVDPRQAPSPSPPPRRRPRRRPAAAALAAAEPAALTAAAEPTAQPAALAAALATAAHRVRPSARASCCARCGGAGRTPTSTGAAVFFDAVRSSSGRATATLRATRSTSTLIEVSFHAP